MTRKSISMAEKLAAALLELQGRRGDPIDREHAKEMSAKFIISLFQFDHAAGYVASGADNHPTGLTPLLIAEHRHKTATLDVPAIAKGKRLSAAHEAFRAKMLAKAGQEEPAELSKKKPKKDNFSVAEPTRDRKVSRKIQSRGFQKGHRPIQSRPFAKVGNL